METGKVLRPKAPKGRLLRRGRRIVSWIIDFWRREDGGILEGEWEGKRGCGNQSKS